MAQPDHAREWLRQRLLGATAVAEIERGELRRLEPAAALAQSEALLSAMSTSLMPPGRVLSSGLVEQQRFFLRARR